MPQVYNKRSLNIPPGAVYVGRPTRWGNPFTVQKYGRGHALKLYNQWIQSPEAAGLREEIVRELAGKDLICWCAPQPCHADTLIKIANPEME